MGRRGLSDRSPDEQRQGQSRAGFPRPSRPGSKPHPAAAARPLRQQPPLGLPSTATPPQHPTDPGPSQIQLAQHDDRPAHQGGRGGDGPHTEEQGRSLSAAALFSPCLRHDADPAAARPCALPQATSCVCLPSTRHLPTRASLTRPRRLAGTTWVSSRPSWPSSSASSLLPPPVRRAEEPVPASTSQGRVSPRSASSACVLCPSSFCCSSAWELSGG